MLSVYVLLQIPLDSNFIAAALTILGYSINASIIVFDRVRENLRTARKEPFEVIGEKSIWQTMGRTINTTLTTLFTIGMVYILGVPSLKQFTLPLIVGILAAAGRLLCCLPVCGASSVRSSAAAARSNDYRKGTRSGAFLRPFIGAGGAGNTNRVGGFARTGGSLFLCTG